jgi:hypothetical protein
MARGPKDALAENLAADRFAVHRAASVEKALALQAPRGPTCPAHRAIRLTCLADGSRKSAGI